MTKKLKILKKQYQYTLFQSLLFNSTQKIKLTYLKTFGILISFTKLKSQNSPKYMRKNKANFPHFGNHTQI